MDINKRTITVVVLAAGFSSVLVLGIILKADTLRYYYMINGNQAVPSPASDLRYEQDNEPSPCPLPGTGWFTSRRIRSTVLASFPGSGNTWTRYLLTTASGILTGNRYTFEAAVNMKPKQKAYRVLVIKTHEKPKTTRSLFPVDRCLLLIRNPYDALLADFNRRGKRTDKSYLYSVHKTVRPPEDFEKDWPKFVSQRMAKWSDLYTSWSAECKPPNLHVLVYSRMVENLGRELDLVFRFLNESIITPRIHCATQHSEGKDHRSRHDWQKKVAIFTQEQKRFLNAAIDRVRRNLQKVTGANFKDFQAWKR